MIYSPSDSFIFSAGLEVFIVMLLGKKINVKTSFKNKINFCGIYK